MMEVGHVMQRDAARVHDETLGIGLGLGRLRDGSGTKGGMSHNSIPPSRPHLEAWEGWSMPVLWCFTLEIKGGMVEKDRPGWYHACAVELAAAMAAANDNLATLVQQQAQVKEQEEREEQEVKDAAIGSLSLVYWVSADLGLARLANMPPC